MKAAHGNLEAYLVEATIRPNPANTLYTRVESVAKSILDAGFHPIGIFHRHRQSQAGYAVPANLKDPYGSLVSFHVFLRYRAARATSAAAPVHVH